MHLAAILGRGVTTLIQLRCRTVVMMVIRFCILQQKFSGLLCLSLDLYATLLI
jgi:hypothetical protein